MGILERLILENFKSYKGKHIIGPFSRFTAIIGPNGCGKSNLMDAISFVFGEKTSSLRCRTVRDLIHGANIGQPVGDTAMVTAVYSEEDGTEIIFSRKIHGDQTEYRIDSKVVRVAQYITKLESLGIAIKAKNFLVFQGTVENIAMKNPKERTAMFEEVSKSGTLAADYEKKKVAMQKAEEDTTFNYHKKKGIAAEKKEARAEKDEADRYKKLTEDLENTQLEAQLFRLYHNEQEIQHLTSELQNKEKEVGVMEKRRNTIEERLKGKRQEHARMSREIAAIEKQIRDKEIDLNQKRPLYIKAKENTSHINKRLENSRKSLKKAEAANERHRKEIDELKQELVDVQQAAAQYENEMTESEGEDLQLMDSQLQEYNQLKENAGRQTAVLRHQLDAVNRDQQSDQEMLDQVKQRRVEHETRKEQLEEQRTQLLERIEKLDGYIRTNEEMVRKLTGEKEALSQEIDGANTSHRELSVNLEKVQLELNDARVDKHESSRQQKKRETLESMKRLFPGVYGRLMDHCEPKHKKYALAITKVLGKNMDAIVVDTEKTGKECIQYLREQHCEPETFLPLDTIQAKPTSEKLRQIGGSAKLVIDVINYAPPQIKKALQYACGNALVCDAMEEARSVAFGGAERQKTVSLDGTMFQKSGVISGGASDLKSKARRWDEKHVENLKKKRDKFLSELKELSKHRRKEPELQNLRSQIDGLENRLRYSTKDRETTEKKTLKDNANELKLIGKSLKELQPQREKLLLHIAEREQTIANIEAQMNQVEDTVFAEFCETIGVDNIRQYEEKQLKAQQERAQRKLEFANQESRLRNQLAYEESRDTEAQVKKLKAGIKGDAIKLEESKREEKEQMKIIDDETEDLSKLRLEKQAKKSRMDEKDVEIREIRKALNSHTKEISTLQRQVTTMETQLEQKKSDRHSLLKSCKMEDIQIPMTRGTMGDIDLGDSSASQTDSQPDDNSMEVDDTSSSQASRMISEREANITIDYTLLSRDLKKIDDPAEIRNISNDLTAKISRLQSTVQRIQAPNMKAIEKLDSVSGRLQETNEEFEQARKKAKQAKIDFEFVKKQRYELFMKAFEHISTEIDGIYKSLADNPSAQAFLGPQDPEEPYLAGIDYNCVAPGKRFRPMDNLSGGEKTVAALALLFSCHSFQPAPFFVLDEIDAALDNTNINRVANFIINKTREEFQCIVISLKEEFYTRADALIGITAKADEDCTVSQVFTLDLSQFPQ